VLTISNLQFCFHPFIPFIFLFCPLIELFCVPTCRFCGWVCNFCFVCHTYFKCSFYGAFLTGKKWGFM